VDAESLDKETYDLSAKNPNTPKAALPRSPAEILDEIAALDAEAAGVLSRMRGLLAPAEAP
jgi:type I restriction enzyme M protein